jgi:hypothetical protein
MCLVVLIVKMKTALRTLKFYVVENILHIWRRRLHDDIVSAHRAVVAFILPSENAIIAEHVLAVKIHRLFEDIRANYARECLVKRLVNSLFFS